MKHFSPTSPQIPFTWNWTSCPGQPDSLRTTNKLPPCVQMFLTNTGGGHMLAKVQPGQTGLEMSFAGMRSGRHAGPPRGRLPALPLKAGFFLNCFVWEITDGQGSVPSGLGLGEGGCPGPSAPSSG